MQGIEFSDEVISVTVAIGGSLESADLVIDAFESAGRDGEVVPVEDAGPMSFQCVGHCLENLDAGGPGAGTPVFQVPACDGFVGLLPDLTEVLFQVVGDRQRLIQVECFHQSCPFILCFIEILLMLEQQKAKEIGRAHV